jgi:hypothetical protein
MIRKLPNQQKFRIYNKTTGRNLGTFRSKSAALKHERDIEYFKRRA